jgi:hypothetical protein
VTVEALRAKLDAAILAEAWDAVPVIRQRIVEAELGAREMSEASPVRAGANVVTLSSRRRTPST